MTSRERAVVIFGREEVERAEADPAPEALLQKELLALAALTRQAVPLGVQAWLMRVRTWVDEHSPAQRLAIIRCISGGVAAEVVRLRQQDRS